jgi:hypothetical protein
VPPRPGYWASAWFGLGVLAGAVLLAAMTVRADLRSPGCRRHLLWPARDALRALTSHPVFKEVTGASAVPPRSAFAHRRNGCADVFYLREPGPPAGNAVRGQPQRRRLGRRPRGNPQPHGAYRRLKSQYDRQETARFRQEDVMRAHPWAEISALASLALLAGCAGASSTGPSARAGTGQPSSATATSPPASPARPSSTPAAASGTATPACVGRDLKVTVFGGAAATASIAGEIGFTNVGGAPCHLAGYPVVTGVTASGGQVSAGHELSTEFGPNITGITAVPLAPHATAVAVVTGNDVLGTCASGTEPTFRYLRVRPPGSAVSTTVTALLPALGSYLPDCDKIGVTPVASAGSVPRQGST